jgi:hypothetical protein
LAGVPLPELKDYIVKYQDPQQADSIMKIQKELDETKIVLHKTIESVLQRGEKIDDLVAKSDGLSAQSKMFYSSFFPILVPRFDSFANHRFSTSKEAEFLLYSDVDRSGSAGVRRVLFLLDEAHGSATLNLLGVSLQLLNQYTRNIFPQIMNLSLYP